MHSAIILAAGKSSKFFPPLYGRPKGLFVYRGEVLIERQIRQLKDAGVADITVVIGYEKERFFYLADKFGVQLVVSTHYNDESNLSSLDIVRDKLGNSYLCCADHWYAENPFLGEVPGRSVRLVRPQSDATHELVVDMGVDGRLSNLRSRPDSGFWMGKARRHLLQKPLSSVPTAPRFPCASAHRGPRCHRDRCNGRPFAPAQGEMLAKRRQIGLCR